mmetsp:Transcript_18925/g.72179  ORF Transcript_18925/g.72179 Transcript_18925/m.72179 type:complete len:426 (-) Transcript_18925:1601-2878(-)
MLLPVERAREPGDGAGPGVGHGRGRRRGRGHLPQLRGRAGDGRWPRPVPADGRGPSRRGSREGAGQAACTAPGACRAGSCCQRRPNEDRRVFQRRWRAEPRRQGRERRRRGRRALGAHAARQVRVGQRPGAAQEHVGRRWSCPRGAERGQAGSCGGRRGSRRRVGGRRSRRRQRRGGLLQPAHGRGRQERGDGGRRQRGAAGVRRRGGRGGGGAGGHRGRVGPVLPVQVRAGRGAARSLPLHGRSAGRRRGHPPSVPRSGRSRGGGEAVQRPDGRGASRNAGAGPRATAQEGGGVGASARTSQAVEGAHAEACRAAGEARRGRGPQEQVCCSGSGRGALSRRGGRRRQRRRSERSQRPARAAGACSADRDQSSARHSGQLEGAAGPWRARPGPGRWPEQGQAYGPACGGGQDGQPHAGRALCRCR